MVLPPGCDIPRPDNGVQPAVMMVSKATQTGNENGNEGVVVSSFLKQNDGDQNRTPTTFFTTFLPKYYRSEDEDDSYQEGEGEWGESSGGVERKDAGRSVDG